MHRHCVLLAAFLLTAEVADAAPFAFYNFATGGITVTNDHSDPLYHVTVLSPGGYLTDASQMLSLPGAIKDETEFPTALTYLNFPQGRWYIGKVVKLGAPLSDVSIQYRTPDGSTGPPLQMVVNILPEPTSAALLGMSLISIAGLRRHRRRSA